MDIQHHNELVDRVKLLETKVDLLINMLKIADLPQNVKMNMRNGIKYIESYNKLMELGQPSTEPMQFN